MNETDRPTPPPPSPPLRSWVRRTALTLADPRETSIRIGSHVKCISLGRKEHEARVTLGAVGKVIEVGKGSLRARKAVGTTDALRVEWQP